MRDVVRNLQSLLLYHAKREMGDISGLDHLSDLQLDRFIGMIE